MTLILEKPETELNNLGTEFMLSLGDGTLTEARYNEIISIMVANKVMPEAIAGMIIQVPEQWRNKGKPFRIVSTL